MKEQFWNYNFGGKMLKALIVTAVLVSQATLALAEGENCKPVREGKAHVKVETLHWTQEKGSYKLVSKTACETTSPLNILPSVATDCMSPVLVKCNLSLDGSEHVLNVSGYVYHNESGVKKKHFTAGYHLDRNTSEVQTGEAANVGIQTSDLAMKKIEVQLQSKLDSPNPRMSTRDAVSVTVEFEDSDAP
jgi:hypothetical protein